MNSIQKVVDDERSLGPLASGTARHTSSTAALTQQDFEVATRLGPNGVAMKSVDQLVPAPKADRNPWNPAADRTSVNQYDHVMDALRTSALKRDAALAGSSGTAAAADTTADTAAAPAPATAEAQSPAHAPLTPDQFGEAYVRDAIAAYERNSSLHGDPAPVDDSPVADPVDESPVAGADDSPLAESPDETPPPATPQSGGERLKELLVP
ncbi:hypothetical protein OM076_21125 [Solirubrobacter ginsenosidimutans]|uniref:Uncharacterized protein n=1 Tax=Solirubrobacter ginsenosidimutans TaxID=490573 RepID=A0A9X3MUD9_9ACTN|nr:hypothetical protein [Solirubrobacter ginsenosidimutans]MDA0162789.1 hypothetical protein [Solirubrobacter ginsenosidimutans]